MATDLKIFTKRWGKSKGDERQARNDIKIVMEDYTNFDGGKGTVKVSIIDTICYNYNT